MFSQKNADIKKRDDARKRKINADDAWEIIAGYKKIIIGKGKKSIEYIPGDENKDEILKAAMGRSGNLRAPAIDSGGTLVIGFNEELYNGIV